MEYMPIDRVIDAAPFLLRITEGMFAPWVFEAV